MRQLPPHAPVILEMHLIHRMVALGIETTCVNGGVKPGHVAEQKWATLVW
jgi:hypothetical protein